MSARCMPSVLSFRILKGKSNTPQDAKAKQGSDTYYLSSMPVLPFSFHSSFEALFLQLCLNKRQPLAVLDPVVSNPRLWQDNKNKKPFFHSISMLFKGEKFRHRLRKTTVTGKLRSQANLHHATCTVSVSNQCITVAKGTNNNPASTTLILPPYFLQALFPKTVLNTLNNPPTGAYKELQQGVWTCRALNILGSYI